MIFTLLFIAACFLAFTNGANDNFKGVATLFGSNTTNYKKAISWATGTTFLGSISAIYLAGQLVKNFSGKGLVPDELIQMPPFAISIALGAAITVFLATKIGMPISTTHGLVGALLGAGLMAVGPGFNFSKLGSTFLIPELMARLNSDTFSLPYYDLKNIWPLNYYNFDQYRIDEFISAGNIGIALLIFGVVSIFIITPILTYKYGKRWYCSWVCGCGGLAETAGDPFRHLSNKSLSAWKVERWLVHSVLVFVVLMTTAAVYSYLGDTSKDYWLTRDVFLIGVAVLLTAIFAGVMLFKRNEFKKDAKYGAVGYLVVILALIGLYYLQGAPFLLDSGTLRSTYGFFIGSIFAGVIGTGFYPIFGNRVWCRMGCPMAAILGFQQRLFSKFRITTNGGQCISCGNCSTYCEMGIDVRAYAQKGENIVRSSCVGCGICASVCPRGVLKLENDSMNGCISSNEILLGNDVDLTKLMNEK